MLFHDMQTDKPSENKEDQENKGHILWDLV